MHGHALSLIVPDASTFVDVPESPLERDVFSVYRRSEARRWREAKAALAPLGCAVVRATGEDRPGILIVQAQRATRRRAA
ncbi:MAG TPA: hypothetical protein DEF51_45045 [Myxococcales bacterium]|nr:hypothetical protein [Myxococcales bacterium]